MQDIFSNSPSDDIKKKWAILQLQGGSDVSPVRHWTQALARAVQGGMGGYMLNQAEAEDKAAGDRMFSSLPGMTLSAPPAAPAQPPSAAAPVSPGQKNWAAALSTKPMGNVNIPATDVSAAYSRPEVAPSAKVWGDKEAEAAGLYEPSSKVASAIGGVPLPQPRPVQPQPATPQPQGVQVADASRSPVQIPPDVQATIARLGADPKTRGQAWELYKQYVKPVDQWETTRGNDGSIYQRNRLTGEMKVIEKSDVLPEQAVVQKERIAAAGKPVTTIDQRSQDEFEKKYGGGMGEEAVKVIQAGNAATKTLQRINLTQSLLNQAKSGAIAPAQATVGAWAKAVGIDPSTLGIDPNLPVVSQAATALINQQIIGMIGAGGFPANNFSNADRTFIASGVANIGNLPEANEIMSEVGRRVAQRDIEKARAWSAARRAKMSYEDFEANWIDKVSKENMFADLEDRVKKLQGGNLPPPGAASSPQVDNLVKKYGGAR